MRRLVAFLAPFAIAACRKDATRWREPYPSPRPPSSSDPLSLLTVRSLEDLGYTVNAAGADPFQLTLSLQAQIESDANRRPYGDDVIHVPLFAIDHRGRITRIRI